MSISYVATYANYYEIPVLENEIDDNLLKLLERLFQENLEDIKKGKSLSISRKEDSYIASIDEDVNKEYTKFLITDIHVIGSKELKREVIKTVLQETKNSIESCKTNHSEIIGIEVKMLDRFVRVESYCENVYFGNTAQTTDDYIYISDSTVDFDDLSLQTAYNTNKGFL